MNAEEYKSICRRPDALQRGIIEATEQALKGHSDLVLKFREILEGTAIPKPDSHNESKESSYFLVKLNVEDVEQILDYLFDAEASAVGLNGETTPMTSHYASLVDVWRRYIDFCESEINN
jgi:hypothetical protein